MARETYVWDPEQGQVVPKAQRRRREVHGAGAHVISDTVAPFQSMVDGQVYDSKSQYGRSLSEANARTGRDYRVVGNDVGHLTRETPYEPRGVDRSIQRALERFGC